MLRFGRAEKPNELCSCFSRNFQIEETLSAVNQLVEQSHLYFYITLLCVNDSLSTRSYSFIPISLLRFTRLNRTLKRAVGIVDNFLEYFLFQNEIEQTWDVPP